MSLRVAMVVERFPSEPFLAQQIAALIERSVDVHVLCQIHDRHSPTWSLLSEVDLDGRIHPWPDRGAYRSLAVSAGRTSLTSLRHYRAALAAAIRTERSRSDDRGPFGRVLFDTRLLTIEPDVVHFQFGDLARDRVHVAHSIEAAFTASFRGYDLAYAGLDRPDFYDHLWPVLHGAHTLGQDLLELARQRGAPQTLDWTIIPPAVEMSRFPRPIRTEHDGAIRIVSVGRLHWKKGLPDGLAAVAELVASGRQVTYRIVGAGPVEEELRWTINDLGLADSVELMGQRNLNGVREQLAWADIFLHPALSEGFGNAVLEAQAMALPVVCTDAIGLTENVIDGWTGLVVPRRRPERLAVALSELAADRPRRLEMGRHGRQRVAEQFDLDRQADRFVEFFTTAHARWKAGRG